MKIASILENQKIEKRIAITPEIAKKYISLGLEVVLSENYGTHLGIKDEEYNELGVSILNDEKEIISNADIIVQLGLLSDDKNSLLRENQTFIGVLNPYDNKDKIDNLVKKNINPFSLELLPRITRAQSMDILSSQASIAGYQSSLLAANHLKKYFPMLITAAGTISPAKILVIGAGVAGLQAIATCNRLGAKVTGFDVRQSTKEQVESVGGKFLELNYEYDDSDKQGYAKEQSLDKQEKQNELLSKYIQSSDCVITTASIPGKKAPLIVTKKNIENMNFGSVIIDLAGESGGNCEIGDYGEVTNFSGVIIDKPKNITNLVSEHSSLVFSRNVEAYLDLIIDENKVNLDPNDEIIKSTNLNLEAKIE